MFTTDQRALLAEALREATQKGERRETEWRLITGAPGSGKTTLCRLLADRGFTVVDDPARSILDADAANGIASASARLDYVQFQHRVLDRALSSMAAHDPTQPVYFDYGIAESLAFLTAAGHDWPPRFLHEAVRLRFRVVYVLDAIDLHRSAFDDGIRTESDAQRQRLQALIPELYALLGERVRFVEGASPQERLEWILRNST
jgi:predicted ATPase